MTTMEQFITALRSDPDLPPDVVITPLYSHNSVNVKRASTSDADQWQAAVRIDTPLHEAIEKLVNQHEMAQDRIKAQAKRAEISRITQALQEELRQESINLSTARAQRMTARRAAIRTRYHVTPEVPTTDTPPTIPGRAETDASDDAR